MLQLAKDLALPDDAATRKYAIVGGNGSGKSYFAGKLIELLLDAGRQVVLLDPVGIWYGLRLLPSGKDSGFKIPILGGDHGDIPLEPTGGELIADIAVDTGQSMILDVTEMTGGEQHRFVADFETRLFRRKKAARSPLLLAFDEAQEFFPQNINTNDKYAAHMLGAGQRLVRIGRNFGIGVLLITPRPQAVSKEVLNLTEVLTIFQTNGPQERKTIEGWVQEHGFENRDIKDRLPSLQKGHGLLWSPQWLRVFQAIHCLPKKTMDTSATPTEEQRAIATTPIDLSLLQQQMAETIERAKDNDPAELRRRLRQAEEKIEELERGDGAVCAPSAQDVDTAVALAVREAVQTERAASRDAISEIVEQWRHLCAALAGSQEVIDQIVEAEVRRLAAPVPEPNQPPERTHLDDIIIRRRNGRAAEGAGPENRSTRKDAAGSNPASSANPAALVAGPKRVLQALRQRPQDHFSISQLITLCGYAERTVQKYLNDLRGGALIDGDGHSGIQITKAGIEALGSAWEPLPRGHKLREHYRRTLPEGPRNVMEAVCASQRPASVASIMNDTRYAERTVQKYLSDLRARRIIYGDGREGIKPSDELFG